MPIFPFSKHDLIEGSLIDLNLNFEMIPKSTQPKEKITIEVREVSQVCT